MCQSGVSLGRQPPSTPAVPDFSPFLFTLEIEVDWFHRNRDNLVYPGTLSTAHLYRQHDFPTRVATAFSLATDTCTLRIVAL